MTDCVALFWFHRTAPRRGLCVVVLSGYGKTERKTTLNFRWTYVIDNID